MIVKGVDSVKQGFAKTKEKLGDALAFRIVGRERSEFDKTGLELVELMRNVSSKGFGSRVRNAGGNGVPFFVQLCLEFFRGVLKAMRKQDENVFETRREFGIQLN